MKVFFVLLLTASFALAQSNSIESAPTIGTETFKPGNLAFFPSTDSRGVRAISLQPTVGGGMRIEDCEDGYSAIVEILSDGTVKGDPVRALRMLASTLANVLPNLGHQLSQPGTVPVFSKDEVKILYANNKKESPK